MSLDGKSHYADNFPSGHHDDFDLVLLLEEVETKCSARFHASEAFADHLKDRSPIFRIFSVFDFL